MGSPKLILTRKDAEAKKIQLTFEKANGTLICEHNNDQRFLIYKKNLPSLINIAIETLRDIKPSINKVELDEPTYEELIKAASCYYALVAEGVHEWECYNKARGSK